MNGPVFIADDFGLDEATNLAIVRAHREGALQGASLMLGQPGTAQAVALAREHPGLHLGWHLHLCDSRPVTRAAWPWCASPGRAGLAIGLLPSARKLMRQEVREQWRQFTATGLTCDFVNAHHHLHVHPAILREVLAVLPANYSGWLRGFGVRSFDRQPKGTGRMARLLGPAIRSWLRRGSPLRTSDTLWGVDRLFGMEAGEIRAVVKTLPRGLHEFVFHPRGTTPDADLKALLQLRA
jgi:predicted glycoside hydrolase/deacetylase ChbG (UPF0249 family)